jgi:sulfur-carrier protein adenylyltransferase/sulfurtransferase
VYLGARRVHFYNMPPHNDMPARSPVRTATDLVNEAKGRITEVGAERVQEMQDRGEPVTYLDVREQNEWNMGHLPRATLIPRGVLESTVEQRVPRDATVVIYCASGNRSAMAADTLQQMGYSHVSSMAGGYRAWVAAGGMVEG